jgi:GNAT superfamily N-acetyltransferase
MPDTDTDPESPHLERLRYEPYGFTCSREAQQDFLFRRALGDQEEDISRSFLAYVRADIVGYITLAMDAIPLKPSERPNKEIPFVWLPAVKLCQLAVDARYERRGYGKQLVALAAGMALELSQHVGCRYLTVDAAESRLVDWYGKQDFTINKLDETEKRKRAEKRGVDPSTFPTSMRLDLHTLLLDLQEHYPRDFPKE